ncbi:MAG: hypothetical protein M3081_05740 [Gemmatimonadota bacterium]|nr:hypothetical protein [Gemmatimonadota bacterium]
MPSRSIRSTLPIRAAIAVALSVLVGALAATSAQAQIPIIPPSATNAKNAAQKAVDATNTHTEAMQRDQSAQQPATKQGPQPHSASAQQQPQPPVKGAPSTPVKGAPASPLGQPATSPVQKQAPGGKGATSTSAGGVAPQRNEQRSGDGKNELSLMREAFAYESEGRRDPFVSLLATGELRPMIQDLKLVAVIYDPGGRSVAILRDVSAKEQYRVKVGQALGRMRVVQITPRAVTFTLEEFGYSRQEVLALNVQPK